MLNPDFHENDSKPFADFIEDEEIKDIKIYPDGEVVFDPGERKIVM